MSVTKTKCVEMVGPDTEMDAHGSSSEPANRLPAKCGFCSFPDLDFVPQPYVLTKGVASPSEISQAKMGNFLVRERVRRILEVAVPGACKFYPTVDKKTKKAAEWFLAVPNAVVRMPGREPDATTCPKCGEPKLGYSFGNYDAYIAELKQFDSQGVDILKSKEWDCMRTAEDDLASINEYRAKEGMAAQSWKEYIHWAIPGLEPPPHPGRWTRQSLDRLLFFSLRLEQLLKRARVKGQLVRSYSFKDVPTSPEDESWIKEKLKLLESKGLAGPTKPAQTADATQKWFKQFLKKNAAKSIKPAEFSEAEKRHKVKLPQDYKDYVSSIGSKAFRDVGGLEGSSTRVLTPDKLDFKNYRRGKVPHLEGEQAEVDGVVFAEIDNGDCFVFDISSKGSEYPIYWHRHEENELEAFAPTFAECIKRFSEKA